MVELVVPLLQETSVLMKMWLLPAVLMVTHLLKKHIENEEKHPHSYPTHPCTRPLLPPFHALSTTFRLTPPLTLSQSIPTQTHTRWRRSPQQSCKLLSCHPYQQTVSLWSSSRGQWIDWRACLRWLWRWWLW